MSANSDRTERLLTKKGRRQIATHQQSIGLECLNRSFNALSDCSIAEAQQLMFEIWVALFGLRCIHAKVGLSKEASVQKHLLAVYGLNSFSTQVYFKCFTEQTLRYWLAQLWLDEWGTISIDGLGICYEQGLELELQRNSNSFEWKISEARGAKGAYFTPPQLSTFLVKELIQLALIEQPSCEPTDLRICDPACGAGAFLRATLLELLKLLEPTEPSIDIKLKLANCLVGVDLDFNATVVASISIWLTLGADSPRLLKAVRQRFVCGDALLMADVHGEDRVQDTWETAFPEVMCHGGFDIIVGNPPYLSAMTGGISKSLKKRYRDSFPRLTGRADLSAYFWDLSTRLSKKGGVIGLVLPRPLLGVSACSELRRPDSGYVPRMIYSPEHYAFFDDVSIKIMCLVLGPKGNCRISNSPRPETADWHLVDDFHSPWEYTQHNWWAPFVLSTTGTRWPSVPPKRLESEGFTVRAGIGPVDFYKIVLVDDPTATVGPKLIVSGLIDPDRCDWGRIPARYKGRLFMNPCVDASHPVSSSFKVHLDFAKRPKLILANLVTRIECMLDSEGECIGATATYCIFEDNDNVLRLKWLCNILHQPDSTRLFHLALGANAMHSNLSIRSGFLKSFPLPVEKGNR